MDPSKFPASLRVLVVDSDPTSLKSLDKMLKKCDYQVTTSSRAQEALAMLQHGVDIVLIDVSTTDMDGYKLLQDVVNLDLPVILMSVHGEVHSVMKGIRHGACDYLVKPVRQKEVSNIWRHVYRKRMKEKTVEVVEEEEENEVEKAGDGEGSEVSGMKRKESSGGCSSVKKPRVVWSGELCERFKRAVDTLGGVDKCGPKKIRDLMGLPWLTRENVASHLQKYRILMSRQHNGNSEAPSLGFNFPDSQPNHHCYQTAPNQSYFTTMINENICDGPAPEIQSIPPESSSRISLNHQQLDFQNLRVKSEFTTGLPSLQYNDQSYFVGPENALPVQPNANPVPSVKTLEFNGCAISSPDLVNQQQVSDIGCYNPELVYGDQWYGSQNFESARPPARINGVGVNDYGFICLR